MKVVESRAEFAAARAALPGPVGFVATMGALHAGHAALMNAARGDVASVVTTIFVNPLQFGPAEDLARYPRTLEADLTLCEKAGVDLVWAPRVEDVYAHGPVQVTVAAGPLGDLLEGASRPGHFSGMLTVVAKLLNLVRPDRAYFGEKDYQQLTLIRAMVLDLELGAEIVGVPTVREADGLALSSRNVYLTTEQRTHALTLSRALQAGIEAQLGGVAAVLEAATKVAQADPDVDFDYVALRSAQLDDPQPGRPARLLVAARVGTTRLIDNVGISL